MCITVLFSTPVECLWYRKLHYFCVTGKRHMRLFVWPRQCLEFHPAHDEQVYKLALEWKQSAHVSNNHPHFNFSQTLSGPRCQSSKKNDHKFKDFHREIKHLHFFYSELYPIFLFFFLFLSLIFFVNVWNREIVSLEIVCQTNYRRKETWRGWRISKRIRGLKSSVVPVLIWRPLCNSEIWYILC